jgi:type II restriction/modification system DNA methylase subunit YeeA
MTAEHRVFYWLSYPVLPDNNLVVVTKDDDVTFGILSGRFHELWSTARGNRMGAGNQRRYNGTSIFETFPFPDNIAPNDQAEKVAANAHGNAIAAAAKRLNDLREAWLNPSELTRRVPEALAGLPDRVLAVNEAAATELKKRTLTNLYNLRPAWLDNAHKALDAAVADAYGWSAAMSDEEVLSRLLELNNDRALSASTSTSKAVKE